MNHTNHIADLEVANREKKIKNPKKKKNRTEKKSSALNFSHSSTRTFGFCTNSLLMANVEPTTAGDQDAAKTPHRYVAWGLLPDPVSRRIKNVTEGLRAEFGGPEIIVPHIPILGSIILTEEDAVNTFRQACQAIGTIPCKVTHVATSPFYYQCVHLFIDPDHEVVYDLFIFYMSRFRFKYFRFMI